MFKSGDSRNQTRTSHIRLRTVGILILVASCIAVVIFSIHGKTNAQLAGVTVLLAGDSRSSTDYTFYQSLLETRSGCKVIVDGFSGAAVAYNASDEYFDSIRENPHDFSIWLVGGNDTGEPGTVGTFSNTSALAAQGEPIAQETDINEDYSGETFIQAVDHIMRKYKTIFKKDQSESSQLEYHLIFCTDLPQQRYNQESPWSQRENWERKRLAILECCEKNDVHCLDLYALCDFDMSAEPMFVPPTDKETNRGGYYMDGLHPNERGMGIIVDLEIKEMEGLREIKD